MALPVNPMQTVHIEMKVRPTGTKIIIIIILLFEDYTYFEYVLVTLYLYYIVKMFIVFFGFSVLYFIRFKIIISTY